MGEAWNRTCHPCSRSIDWNLVTWFPKVLQSDQVPRRSGNRSLPYFTIITTLAITTFHSHQFFKKYVNSVSLFLPLLSINSSPRFWNNGLLIQTLLNKYSIQIVFSRKFSLDPLAQLNVPLSVSKPLYARFYDEMYSIMFKTSKYLHPHSCSMKSPRRLIF